VCTVLSVSFISFADVICHVCVFHTECGHVNSLMIVLVSHNGKSEAKMVTRLETYLWDLGATTSTSPRGVLFIIRPTSCMGEGVLTHLNHCMFTEEQHQLVHYNNTVFAY
jgi:hypothetical protein